MVTRCQSAVASQPPPWTTGASSRRGRCGKLWDTGLKSPRPSRESGVPTLPAEGCGRGDGLSGHMHHAASTFTAGPAAGRATGSGTQMAPDGGRQVEAARCRTARLLRPPCAPSPPRTGRWANASPVFPISFGQHPNMDA